MGLSATISGSAFVMTLTMIALSFGVAEVGAAKNSYFPPTLYGATMVCDYGDGQKHFEPVMNGFIDAWYSGELRSLGERPLYVEAGSVVLPRLTTLRFTWLRSFHNPVSIRVEYLQSGRARMTATRARVAGSHYLGHVQRVERVLTHEELDRLDSTRLGPDSDAGEYCRGADGSNWIIEESGPEGYAFVDRWSPEDGPVRELGMTLLNFTGWKIDPVY
jgi:hypothetical protein